MTHKKILFRAAAREKILAGASALADAVRVTLGPKSRSILIARKWGGPLVCDDGVTIAKEIDLEDPDENLGAQMLRQAAARTGDAVGDGTSTATVLAHAIYEEGLRNVAARASAIDLKRGLDLGLAATLQALGKLSRPIRSRREKEQVATISAHGDPRIGAQVADALEKVGAEGAITVEEAKATETVVEVIEGMQFDRGYLSPYMITRPEEMRVELEEPLILIHEKRITSLRELLPLLEEVAKRAQPLLVIAEEVEGDALAGLVVNKMRGVLPCAAAKAPGYGDRRKEILRDIAILTGGQVVAEELGQKLETLSPEILGRAKRVVMDKDTTTIVGGTGSRAAIRGRCEEIRRQIADATSDYDREKLEERLAKLTGGVAVIRVGAPSEAEMKSRKDAFEDAIRSTKAAIAEGVVPGGGTALLRSAEAVERAARDAEGDVRTGVRVLLRALEAPARQIARNSDADDGVVIDRIRAGKGAFGFDAATGKYVDLIEAGILDPTKVVRTAIENAVSVAGVLLLTEGTLTEIPEPKIAQSATPGDM